MKRLLFLLIIITSFVGCQNKPEPVVQRDTLYLTDTISGQASVLPSGFCLLTDSIPGVILEMRYFSTYNFTGRRIPGYEQPVALLTCKAAGALKKVAEEMEQKGYRLKIFDCYRPQQAVAYFVRWAGESTDTLMRQVFYPCIEKSSLFAKGFISSRSGHTRGSTIDLTLFDIAKGKEVDMGGPFDFFGEVSRYNSSSVTAAQHSNRKLLREVMDRHGFSPIATEWWHFTLRNEPFPHTYFDFPVREYASSASNTLH